MPLLRIEELVFKWSGFLTANIISAKIYKLGTVSVSNFLKPSLQELLGPRSSMILIILFCIKIYCAWLMMNPNNYISLLVNESVQSKLFLMYL
jgi:hypothetical protein